MEWRYKDDEMDVFIKSWKAVGMKGTPIIRTMLEKITLVFQRNVAKLAGKSPFPRYTGRSAASIAREINVGVSTNRFRGEVFSGLPYIKDVEIGKSPGTVVPWNDLHRWVDLREKRGDIHIGFDKKTSTRKRAVNSYTARLRIKIQKRGTTGYHVFGEGFTKSLRAVDKIIGAAADQLQRMVGHGK